VTYPKKLKSLHVLHHLTYTYNEILQWFNQKQTSLLSSMSNIGTNVEPFDDIIICLPVTFDLTPENLLKEFHFLKMKLNAANAKYISDAMLIISRKISREIFLKYYLQLIQNEQFQKLGKSNNLLLFLNRFKRNFERDFYPFDLLDRDKRRQEVEYDAVLQPEG
jgi:hypothetical protein